MAISWRRFLTILRITWVCAGLAFLIWMVLSFRAQGYDFHTLYQQPEIYVAEGTQSIEVMPIASSQPIGLIFYPGGMVEPRAYLPLAHALAQRGYPVIIVKLPYRSAMLAEQEAAVHAYVRSTIQNSILDHWAVGGHSRGGALAARFVYHYPTAADALILLGTTHPKEANYSLADRAIPVTKIYATRDGIADATTILANRNLLPATTNFVAIEGGNHSQFGYYGFQLGDRRATISRADQQTQIVDAITVVLAGLTD
ncbi:MAG: alpha/beta hydrolase [Caldilineaceae bacterium]